MKKLFIKLFPKLTLQILYYRMYGKFYSSKKPRDLYEKLIWLNFNTQDGKKELCADKYRIRGYLRNLGLEKYLNTLYGVYDSPDTIDFKSLPDKFVLKCTHGANYNILCRDKGNFDIPAAQKKLRKWLHQDYSLNYGELHYRNIPRKIICEEFLSNDLYDFKVYCINGSPKYVMVCTNPSLGSVKYYLYTFDWDYCEFLIDHLLNPNFPKPDCLNELYNLSLKLSSGFKFVRIDTYIHEKMLIFGEMTFTPSGFLDNQTLPSFKKMMGDMIELSN